MFKRSLILAAALLSAALAWAQYTVNFEGDGETKIAYASGTVNLSGLDWDLTEVLIGTSDADFMNGTRSARLRGYGISAMTMLADKSNGLGTVSFQYRRYGTDAQVDWKVEYSTNQGLNWIQVGSSFTAPDTDDVQNYFATVNTSGGVRIRIKRATETGTTNYRLNIDDITLTDYSGTGPVIGVSGSLTAFSTSVGTPSATQSYILSGSNLTANIDINIPTGFEISTDGGSSYHSVTHSVASNFSGEVLVRLTGTSAGAYGGNITHSSAGATNVDLAVSGTVSTSGSGYYGEIYGYGDPLKGLLHTLVKDKHTTEFVYYNTTDQLKYTDEDPLNTDNIIEFYTGWSVSKDLYPDDWNKEHTWSKSHGDFGETAPAGTDLHNLRPCDSSINSSKSNKDFAVGGDPVTDNSPPPGYTSYTGCYTTTDTWEPRDEDKGDTARIIMYMAVRYEGDDFSSSANVDLEIVDHVYTDAGQNLPYYGKLATLLQWHIQDPPDTWELGRNDRIEERQGNRNPFIDRPDFATRIWAPCPLYAENLTQNSFTAHWSTPIDASSYFLQVVTDTIYVSSVSGYENLDVDLVNQYDVTGLAAAGTYYFRLRSFFEDDYSMYSPFYRVDLEDPLPVELAGFTATISVDNHVNLLWVTQSETGVQGFYVFRGLSDNLNNAILASPLIAATNSSQQQSYVFTDTGLESDGIYYYWLQNMDLDGGSAWHGPISIDYSANPTQHQQIPLLTSLDAIYPNPFNPQASIPFSLAAGGPVSIRIYDVRGRLVRSFDLGELESGRHQSSWDGFDSSGSPCPTGLYFIRMATREGTFSRKAMLVK
ncbi:MAG: endonuclease [Candidatus Cloacimonetes bacterium]|nr:endonuclease [Candidatus Cloacimonadota bacterium]